MTNKVCPARNPIGGQRCHLRDVAETHGTGHEAFAGQARIRWAPTAKDRERWLKQLDGWRPRIIEPVLLQDRRVETAKIKGDRL